MHPLLPSRRIVKSPLIQSEHYLSSGNNLRSHQVLISKPSHFEGLTNAQQSLLCDLTSQAVIDPLSAANRLGVEDQTTGINSENLPFAHNVPQVAPPLLQERVNPFQLVRQVRHNPTPLHQNSRPYTKTDCSLLTQVPYAQVLVDDSSTLEGVFNLSLHLDPPVNYVCLRFLSSGIVYQL